MVKALKKTYLAILTFVMAILCILGVTVMHESASAELTGEGTFEMVNGTSVKISENGGIRFRVKMDESVKNAIVNDEDVTLKFIITGKEIFDTVVDGDYTALTPAINEAINENTIYQDGEFWYANGVVNQIAEENRAVDYMCITYITDGTSVRYATVDGKATTDEGFSLSNVRGNLYDVVNSAFLDAEGGYTAKIKECVAYNTWYGTEEYPIVVKNADQYNYFVGLINAGADFGTAYVNVLPTVDASGATLDEGKSFPVNTTFQYTVSFYDGSKLVKSETVVKGGAATAPTVVPESDPYYAYTWNGWKNADGEEVSFENVSANITAYADYTKKLTADGLDAILTMDTAEILNITTTLNHYNNEANKAQYVAATETSDAHLLIKPASEREFIIDFGSIYQIKDIYSISIDYEATWSWGQLTAFNINGATLTNDQYTLLSIAKTTASDGSAVARNTKTFTKETLTGTTLGYSADAYLENVRFDNYGTANWAVKIYGIEIVTEAEQAEQAEIEAAKKENFAELLKMQTEDSLSLWTAGASAKAAPSFATASTYVGGLNAVVINPSSSGDAKSYTLDLGSVYTLNQVESISFTFGCWAYDWDHLYFCVNGVDIGYTNDASEFVTTAPKIDLWTGGGRKNVTMTITQAQIQNSGVALTDLVKNVVFRVKEGGTINCAVHIANVSINLAQAN